MPALIAAALLAGLLFWPDRHSARRVAMPMLELRLVQSIPSTQGAAEITAERPVEVEPPQPEEPLPIVDDIIVESPVLMTPPEPQKTSPGVDSPTVMRVQMGEREGDSDFLRDAIVAASALDVLPRVIEQIEPQYPAPAKRQNLAGQVAVEFVVDESGTVHNPRVLGSTNSIFEQPALRAVAQWRFAPGSRLGRPTSFNVKITLIFSVGKQSRESVEVRRVTR